MWGNRTKIIIEAINSRRRSRNRRMNFSSFIYVLVNCITLLAIVRTTVMNRVPAGSIMTGSVMLVDISLIIDHSIISVLFRNLTISARAKDVIAEVDRAETIAVSMIKGCKSVPGATSQCFE